MDDTQPELRDRHRSRRHYLWKAASNRCALVVGCALVVFSGFMLWPSYGSFWLVVQIYFALPSQMRIFLRAICSPTAYFTCFGLAAIFGVWLSFRSAKRIKAIPYVPPIQSRLDALPASETLVRGSEEPRYAPHELLRATRAGVDAAANDLLRPQPDLESKS